MKKLSKDKEINIQLDSITWSKNVLGFFVVAVEAGKEQIRTNEIIIPSPGVKTEVGEVLKLPVQIRKSIIGSIKKMEIKITVIHVDDGINNKVGSWKEDITKIASSNKLSFSKAINSVTYGLIYVDYFVSTVANVNSLPNYNASVFDAYKTSKSSSLLLQMKEFYSFFDHRQPEIISNAPAFAIHLMCLIERKEPMETILEELNKGSERDLKTMIYTLVSCLHIMYVAKSRRVMELDRIEIINLVFISIFKKTCIEFAIMTDKELADKEPKDYATTIISWLINNVGSGLFCQQIYSAIIFAYACSFGREKQLLLCQTLNITEKKYLSLLNFLPEDNELIYEQIAKNVFIYL